MALNMDLNYLDSQKAENRKEEMKTTEQVMAQGYLVLSEMLVDDLGSHREAVLTAFSLHPTEEHFKMVEKLAILCGKVNPNLDKLSTRLCAKCVRLTVPSEYSEDKDTLRLVSPNDEQVTNVLRKAVREIQSDTEFSYDETELTRIHEVFSAPKRKLVLDSDVVIEQCWQCNALKSVAHKELLTRCEVTDAICNVLGTGTDKRAKPTSNYQVFSKHTLGLSDDICNDLIVLVSSPRWHCLSWSLEWSQLNDLCKRYMQDPEGTVRTVKELKNVRIDFSKFFNALEDPEKEAPRTKLKRGGIQRPDSTYRKVIKKHQKLARSLLSSKISKKLLQVSKQKRTVVSEETRESMATDDMEQSDTTPTRPGTSQGTTKRFTKHVDGDGTKSGAKTVTKKGIKRKSPTHPQTSKFVRRDSYTDGTKSSGVTKKRPLPQSQAKIHKKLLTKTNGSGKHKENERGEIPGPDKSEQHISQDPTRYTLKMFRPTNDKVQEKPVFVAPQLGGLNLNPVVVLYDLATTDARARPREGKPPPDKPVGSPPQPAGANLNPRVVLQDIMVVASRNLPEEERAPSAQPEDHTDEQPSGEESSPSAKQTGNVVHTELKKQLAISSVIAGLVKEYITDTQQGNERHNMKIKVAKGISYNKTFLASIPGMCAYNYMQPELSNRVVNIVQISNVEKPAVSGCSSLPAIPPFESSSRAPAVSTMPAVSQGALRSDPVVTLTPDASSVQTNSLVLPRDNSQVTASPPAQQQSTSAASGGANDSSPICHINTSSVHASATPQLTTIPATSQTNLIPTSSMGFISNVPSRTLNSVVLHDGSSVLPGIGNQSQRVNVIASQNNFNAYNGSNNSASVKTLLLGKDKTLASQSFLVSLNLSESSNSHSTSDVDNPINKSTTQCLPKFQQAFGKPHQSAYSSDPSAKSGGECALLKPLVMTSGDSCEKNFTAIKAVSMGSILGALHGTRCMNSMESINLATNSGSGGIMHTRQGVVSGIRIPPGLLATTTLLTGTTCSSDQSGKALDNTLARNSNSSQTGYTLTFDSNALVQPANIGTTVKSNQSLGTQTRAALPICKPLTKSSHTHIEPPNTSMGTVIRMTDSSKNPPKHNETGSEETATVSVADSCSVKQSKATTIAQAPPTSPQYKNSNSQYKRLRLTLESNNFMVPSNTSQNIPSFLNTTTQATQTSPIHTKSVIANNSAATIARSNLANRSIEPSVLEQLREFESVLEHVTNASQMKERKTQPTPNSMLTSSSIQATSTSTAASESSGSFAKSSTLGCQDFLSTGISSPTSSITSLQKVNITYVNTTVANTVASSSALSSSIPLVVMSNYAQASTSPTLCITTQSSSSPCVTSASNSASSASESNIKAIATKVVKTSKPKTIKSNSATSTKASPVTKPQQKTQEDEQTTQRIYAILGQYAEQLRNSPDLINKPAPRRRSNPPTNPSQSSKRKKTSGSKTKSGIVPGSDVSPGGDDLPPGSEDSSSGMLLSSSNQASPSQHSGEEFDEASVTNDSEKLDNSDAMSDRPLSDSSKPTVTTTAPTATSTVTVVSSAKPIVVGTTTALPCVFPGSVRQVLLGNMPRQPMMVAKGSKLIRVQVSGHASTMLTAVHNVKSIQGSVGGGANTTLVLHPMCVNKSVGAGSTHLIASSTVRQVKLPVGAISSQTLSGVTAQPPVVLPPGSSTLPSPFCGAATQTIGFADSRSRPLGSTLLVNETMLLKSDHGNSLLLDKDAARNSSKVSLILGKEMVPQDPCKKKTVGDKELPEALVRGTVPVVTSSVSCDISAHAPLSDATTLKDNASKCTATSDARTAVHVSDAKKDEKATRCSDHKSDPKEVGQAGVNEEDDFVPPSEILKRRSSLPPPKRADSLKAYDKYTRLCDLEGYVFEPPNEPSNPPIQSMSSTDDEEPLMEESSPLKDSCELFPSGASYSRGAIKRTYSAMRSSTPRAYSKGKTHKKSQQQLLEVQRSQLEAIEKQITLQKSLSEECEDLGVDEPSTSELFPEADLHFDSNPVLGFDASIGVAQSSTGSADDFSFVAGADATQALTAAKAGTISKKQASSGVPPQGNLMHMPAENQSETVCEVVDIASSDTDSECAMVATIIITRQPSVLPQASAVENQQSTSQPISTTEESGMVISSTPSDSVPTASSSGFAYGLDSASVTPHALSLAASAALNLPPNVILHEDGSITAPTPSTEEDTEEESSDCGLNLHMFDDLPTAEVPRMFQPRTSIFHLLPAYKLPKEIKDFTLDLSDEYGENLENLYALQGPAADTMTMASQDADATNLQNMEQPRLHLIPGIKLPRELKDFSLGVDILGEREGSRGAPQAPAADKTMTMVSQDADKTNRQNMEQPRLGLLPSGEIPTKTRDLSTNDVDLLESGDESDMTDPNAATPEVNAQGQKRAPLMPPPVVPQLPRVFPQIMLGKKSLAIKAIATSHESSGHESSESDSSERESSERESSERESSELESSELESSEENQTVAAKVQPTTVSVPESDDSANAQDIAQPPESTQSQDTANTALGQQVTPGTSSTADKYVASVGVDFSSVKRKPTLLKRAGGSHVEVIDLEAEDANEGEDEAVINVVDVDNFETVDDADTTRNAEHSQSNVHRQATGRRRNVRRQASGRSTAEPKATRYRMKQTGTPKKPAKAQFMPKKH